MKKSMLLCTLATFAISSNAQDLHLKNYSTDVGNPLKVLNDFSRSENSLAKKSENIVFNDNTMKPVVRYNKIIDLSPTNNYQNIKRSVARSSSTPEISYIRPLNTQFWGFTYDETWSTYTKDIAHYPVYSPITWTHNNELPNATYQWKYHDPILGAWVTDNNQDELVVTYKPDYTSESTTRNNFALPPVLTVDVPGAGSAEFTDVYTYLQAGGKPEFLFSSGNEYSFGLLPFPHESEGLKYLSYDAGDGQISTPITGYNANADKFWQKYTFNSAFPGEAIPDDYISYVDGFMNLILPTSSPLVVNRAAVQARGIIADDSSLTLKIYALDESGSFELTDTPIVTSVSSGENILKYNPRGATLDYLTFKFPFEEQIILNNDAPGYMVVVSGYHNDKFEYFAPMQSELPNPDCMSYGYLLKYTDYPEQGGVRVSYFHLSNLTSEAGQCYNSFAINLFGHYGWLKCDVDEISLPLDGTTIEVPIDTYYDASEWQITGLNGVDIVPSGRYGDAKLSISADNDVAFEDGMITVSVPGYEHQIRVTGEQTGIGSVVNDGAVVSRIFGLDGAEYNPASQLAPGVYVVKYSDGTVRKIIMK